MPRIIDCPSDAVPGPVETGEDGALGLTPGAAIHNARRDAIEEADDKVIDSIEEDYECRSGCQKIMGPMTIVSSFRYRPPRRAWWTLWIAYWCEGSIRVTRFVQCVRG
jgi:hypothetical protein